MREKIFIALAALAILFLVSELAPAYVVVLKEGKIYQVDSKPETEGGVVLFRAQGRLVSLKKDSVDVEKTRELNLLLHGKELYPEVFEDVPLEKTLEERLEEYRAIQEELRKKNMPKGWIRDEVGSPPHLPERRKWAPGYPKPAPLPEFPEPAAVPKEIMEEAEVEEETGKMEVVMEEGESGEEILEKGWIRNRPGGPVHLEERKKWGTGEEESASGVSPREERLLAKLELIDSAIAEEQANMKKLEELRADLREEHDLDLDDLETERMKIKSKIDKLRIKKERIERKLSSSDNK